MDDELRRDLRVLVPVAVAGVIACASAIWSTTALLIALVLALVVWPISVFAPMRWREQIEERDYMRLSVMILPGLLGLVVAAFGASRNEEFPTAALVVGFGVVHLILVWLLNASTRPDLRRLSPWLAASVWGIGGVLADLPGPVGWTTLAFLSYGLIATHVVLSMIRDAVAANSASVRHLG